MKLQHTSCIFATVAVLLLAVSADAQWTVINLHPAGATSSRAGSVRDGKQGGSVVIDGVTRATIWSGSVGSRVDLHPVGAASSTAGVVDGGYQVGRAHFDGVSHAGYWTGTAASWVDLNPLGVLFSYGTGAGAGKQVGYAHAGEGFTHAAIWSGTPGSWVDMHPTIGVAAYQSRIHDADEDVQVGSVTLEGTGGYLNNRASLWRGTPESWENLHPAVAEFSYIDGAGSGQQVGTVRIAGVLSASVWSGTAASWVNLHPAGMSFSQAYGTFGGQQVGYAWWNGTVDHGYHAAIWSGSSASFVDLHRFLPKRFENSTASGVWSDSRYIYVVGWAYDPVLNRDEAQMWRRRR